MDYFFFVRHYLDLYVNLPIRLPHTSTFKSLISEMNNWSTEKLSSLYEIAQVESGIAGSRSFVQEKEGTKMLLEP